MSKYAMVVAVAGMWMGLASCGDSGSMTATAPATTQERVRQDLNAAGQEIKDAATQAAAQVKPTLERAKAEGQQVIHNVAQKVADSTATQPAATQ